MKIVLAPHVSEKGSVVAERDRQFVFKVADDATKSEIKNAIELMFNVKVNSVTTVIARGKSKRFGAGFGKRSNFKKAYVRLQPGHDIDFLGLQ